MFLSAPSPPLQPPQSYFTLPSVHRHVPLGGICCDLLQLTACSMHNSHLHHMYKHAHTHTRTCQITITSGEFRESRNFTVLDFKVKIDRIPHCSSVIQCILIQCICNEKGWSCMGNIISKATAAILAEYQCYSQILIPYSSIVWV